MKPGSKKVPWSSSSQSGGGVPELIVKVTFGGEEQLAPSILHKDAFQRNFLVTFYKMCFRLNKKR